MTDILRAMADDKRPEEFGRIGVLMGGDSSERPISLKSGKAVTDALQAAGCQAVPVVLETSDEAAVRRQIAQSGIDIAFIALHGHFGEDGRVQRLLESMDIPYPGSGEEASRQALDKTLTQAILHKAGVEVSPFVVIRKQDQDPVEKLVPGNVTWPVVVKPASEGSSIGITLAEDEQALRSALATAFVYDDTLLIEQYIRGRELTVGILHDQALPVVEIKPAKGFFDFHAKYEDAATQYLVPAPLDERVAAAVRDAGRRAFAALGCVDFGRVDIMLDEGNRPLVLEINTIPGFTSTSLLPKAARAAGINFEQLCLILIRLAYGKKKKFSAKK